MSENPDGFEVPVHRSLTQPLLMGGIPRKTAILLLTGGLAGVQAMGLDSVIVVGPLLFVAYLGMVSACKADPQIQDVFLKQWHQPDVLEV